MSTLQQMRSRIADDINRTDLNSQIDKAINRAITHYEKNRFFFNETTGLFSTINGQASYGTADGLPSDIKEIDVATITLSSTFIPTLTRRTYQYIQKYNIGNILGQPYDYAWYQGKLYLYFTPNNVWPVTLSYQKSYGTLSADSDTNDFLTYAEDLIESRASWWVYTRILKDRDSANDSKAEEMDALASLLGKTDKLISTGRITASDF